MLRNKKLKMLAAFRRVSSTWRRREQPRTWQPRTCSRFLCNSPPSIVAAPTRQQLIRLAIASGTPFVGFGIADNGIMIVAGVRDVTKQLAHIPRASWSRDAHLMPSSWQRMDSTSAWAVQVTI